MEKTKEDIKRLKKHLRTYLGKTQEMFIRTMSPVFDLLTAPPLKIELALSRCGGYIPKGENEVVISLFDGNWECLDCWKRWARSRGYILSHELSHYLHFLANPSVEKEKGVYTHERQGWSEEGYFAVETIAELSSLVFYDKIGKLTNDLLLFASTYPYFAPAFGLFTDNRNPEGLLKKLVQMDLKKSFSVISPYRHLLDSPRTNKDLYFGVCVKEERLVA